MNDPFEEYHRQQRRDATMLILQALLMLIIGAVVLCGVMGWGR